ncbi:hypothetical protein GSI_14466 [Ganoderma sinense ZZ0214-1]|uniref:DUF6533 domain-containing protein n=1 Tax=Ganoderma sinense ZZ0214-1 TaxID=1077348 RepID=A0A2G8RNS2_9APHY|nr:hypothetical protein GSI_14466 [Ganoderma sinense ZZ0214-1]
MPTVALEQLRPVLESADVAFFISVASTALVFYEYAITFDLELQQIWGRNISGVVVLFALTRYITLLHRILVILSLSSLHSLDTCWVITWLQVFISTIVIIVLSAIAAIRVYALWNRDWRLLVVLLLAGLFPAATNLYFRSATAVFIAPSKFFTCQSVPTATAAATYKNLSIATRVVSIFVDGLVVVFTWIKTHRVYVLTRKLAFRTNYSALLLRDGTLYFLAVVILNVTAIVYVTNIGSNLLNDIIVTLTSILMSRFLLNLRDQRAQNERESAIRTSSVEASSFALSTVRFQSNVSHSMAGSMIDDDDDEDGDDGNDIDNDANPKWGLEAHVVEEHGQFRRCDTPASTWSSDSSEELLVSRVHGTV